jgi:signal transduction histidine kinase
MLDPPTLLKNVPIPPGAARLRFEYASPSQRSAMSVPEPMAGSNGALLAWLFGRNSVLFLVSAVLLSLGLAAAVISLLFGRRGAVFLHLGLFALAAGCWGVGECNATAFLIPYPALLYLIAFGGLFTLSIPLLRYGMLVLNPRKPFMMKLAIAVTEAAVLTAFALQLAGVRALSRSMYLFHILVPLGLVVFAGVTAREHFRYGNAAAKRFALPAAVLAAAAMLELANYRLRFTDILSLFFISGAFVFTVMLGVIGVRYISDMRRKFDEISAKTAFYRRVSHDLLTPLTRVSTCVQSANARPGDADMLLTKAQSDIMEMAAMINDALRQGREGGA